MDSSSLSLENVFRLRADALAQIREHTSAVDALAAAIADTDAALMLSIDERNIDEKNSLLLAARRLATLLESEVAK